VGKDRDDFRYRLPAGGAVFTVSVAVDRLRMGRLVVWAGFLAIIAVVFAVEMTIQRLWPDGGHRHRALGRFTMAIYCILFVTGTTTYTMLYLLYPGKIG
jgi:Predicted membrane protein